MSEPNSQSDRPASAKLEVRIPQATNSEEPAKPAEAGNASYNTTEPPSSVETLKIPDTEETVTQLNDSTKDGDDINTAKVDNTSDDKSTNVSSEDKITDAKAPVLLNKDSDRPTEESNKNQDKSVEDQATNDSKSTTLNEAPDVTTDMQSQETEDEEKIKEKTVKDTRQQANQQGNTDESKTALVPSGNVENITETNDDDAERHLNQQDTVDVSDNIAGNTTNDIPQDARPTSGTKVEYL